MVKSNSFEDSFDRVIITDESDELYVFDCDSHEAPTYYVALMRGCDIDKPRNLAKSVTVE